jgi:hypothetical protein
MDESEIYNVENYTERDLFQILDINNPTDRELETSILKNVRQYEKDRDENPKSAKLWRFFNDMYKRFFDVDSETLHSSAALLAWNAQGPRLRSLTS